MSANRSKKQIGPRDMLGLRDKWKNLFDSGVLYFDGECIVGVASDGLRVVIGETWSCDTADNYLTAKSTPSDW